MATKPKAVYRTDVLPHGMNAGKEASVRTLLGAWRREAVMEARAQWRLVFETGRTHKVRKSGALRVGGVNAAYVQMVRWQVVGQIDSYLSNRANDFRELVTRSSMDDGIRHQLYFINKCQAWYRPQALAMKDGATIAVETRRLARVLMRQLLKRHRQPNLRHASMIIDQRCIKLTPAARTKTFPLWARISTLDKGRPIDVPLRTYPHFEARQGKRALSVQVMERDGEIVFGVMTDVAEAFAASRAGYHATTEVLTLDLGLKTLFATRDGDLLGQRWMARLLEIDRRITKLAAFRQRHGLKTRSPRYQAYVEQLRGFVRSELGRILNRLVATHAPAEIVVEHIVFRNQALSKRLNRLLTLIGKKEIGRKLQDLTDRLGIVVTEVQAAYSASSARPANMSTKGTAPRSTHFAAAGAD